MGASSTWVRMVEPRKRARVFDLNEAVNARGSVGRMKIALRSLLIALGVVASMAAAEEPVYFEDASLKAAIEDELWVFDPTPTDMLGLTSLALGQGDIASLVGLEHAVNLQTLQITHNRLTDISPLANLSNIERLVLNNNRISDLPALSGLTSLRHLDLHDNQDLSDISAMSGPTNLEELILRYNQITDISSLAALTELERLDLNHNHIGDISALVELTSLQYLDIRNNPLDDSACEIYLPLILANNPNVDLECGSCGECSLSISSSTGGNVTVPGEGIFTYTIGEVVTLRATPRPGFVFSHWSGGFSSMQNPISIAVQGDYNIRAHFLSILEVLYVDDDAPWDIGPHDPGMSDPEEDGTAGHPLDRIQEAIDVAADGASIVVRPGTYCESIDPNGKSIELTGFNPDDPNGLGYPVITGTDSRPVVSFTHDEDPNCTLRGFVITRGKGSRAGALVCSGSSPTIANCLIVGNRSTDPNGAVVCCTNSDAFIVNCTIADNDAGPHGAALRVVGGHVVVSNSILWNNAPNEPFTDDPNALLITYSNIAGGWPGTGNIEADPLVAYHGFWEDSVSGLPAEPNEADAVWIAGDYHLKSQVGRWDQTTQSWMQDKVTSPCINAGDPLDPVEEEPSPNGQIINMGAYGGTPQASRGQ